VKLVITKPLMRGTMVEAGDEGKLKWCPFEYEFLPNFCFICGIIGHVDKGCFVKLKKGGEPQFGKWLKWVPTKRQSFENRAGERMCCPEVEKECVATRN
jgi:hypothetical protein